ncbi:DUF6287 domain-containing protein [Streptococcus marimammalium]|uniref:DUF6287 domain-containing protein n=1 Tax=Streptococcus marimammalium TaxID=269666 RepID=UPI000376BA8E|nr:DUF6287 domain-containing protein [Streptococcus marimammalium]
MNYRFISFLVVILMIISGCSNTHKNKETTDKDIKTKKIISEENIGTIDLSGTFYSNSGETATLKSLNDNKWEIAYSTLDGDVTATFETKWEQTDGMSKSETPMTKSDGYLGFTTIVEYKSKTDIKITMTDGNPSHQMTFTKKEPSELEKYDVVLQGDLTPFEGHFSTDAFNRIVADSGFTYGGYTPEDYFSDRTTVFPTIKKDGYWNGILSHGNFAISPSNLPTKRDGYYVVYLYGTNIGANNAEMTLLLVPPKIKGPDGIVSQERRAFIEGIDGSLDLLEYLEKDWWKAYQSQEKDLDIEAINNGDFSSLVGTWKNGKGNTLVINEDGSTNSGAQIKSVQNSDKISLVPYAGIGDNFTGVALGLYKIGFKNPDGDQSDTSRPRLIITQQGGNYPADSYYYRQ